MRFIVTNELGKLARWLRIIGFDTVYYKETDMARLAIMALRDNRIVITRNRSIPHLKKIMVVLRTEDVFEQLREVKEKIDLPIQPDTMFTRCTLCNAVLESITRLEVQKKVPKYVFTEQEYFRRCPACDKIYWQGSHWGNIREVIAKLKAENQQQHKAQN